MDTLRRCESWHLSVTSIAITLAIPQTPATCSNIALHNLYPGQIDLLVGSGLPTFLFAPPSSHQKRPPTHYPSSYPGLI